tara:strand:+ start:42 stop:1061 length:1020 start_codon:yes stop_codon:yes gene_type:complete
MLEDYTFKYIDKLFSRNIDREELHLDEIFTIFSEINNKDNKYVLEEKDPTKKEIFEKNPYIPQTFKNTMRTFHKHYNYKVKFPNCSVDLNIHCKNENIDELLYHILEVLRFMMSIDDNKKSFSLHIYLTDYKKSLSRGSYTPSGINSGSTDRNDSIIIWRKEDILKVLIHEIIHLLGFDNVEDNEDIINHYNEKYRLGNKKLNIYEAYTEIWALLIHSYYLAYITQKSLITKISIKELFQDYVLIEKHWCNELGGKLLDYFKDGEDVDKRTNTTSYYIIKTEILNDLKDFLLLTKLNIRMNDNVRFLNYLKNLSKIKKIKTSQKRLSSTMIINSLKIKY